MHSNRGFESSKLSALFIYTLVSVSLRVTVLEDWLTFLIPRAKGISRTTPFLRSVIIFLALVLGGTFPVFSSLQERCHSWTPLECVTLSWLLLDCAKLSVKENGKTVSIFQISRLHFLRLVTQKHSFWWCLAHSHQSSPWSPLPRLRLYDVFCRHAFLKNVFLGMLAERLRFHVRLVIGLVFFLLHLLIVSFLTTSPCPICFRYH